MHILVAPNAFKNSLSASDAAQAIRTGLLDSGVRDSIECFPIGDGGDGTASLIVQHLGGYVKEVFANDPLGRKIKTSIGFIDEGKTAVIEMADISGIKLLKQDEFDPLHTTTFGCGELIRFALDHGAQKIILGAGGSATIDGGCGALRALGVRFLDRYKNELTRLPESLTELDSIDASGIDERILRTALIILCDVNNFLLGENGAAAVFGPQKGASADNILYLENALTRFRDTSFIQTGIDVKNIRHGGAAGGLSAGLYVFLHARLVQGIEYFLDITGFDKSLDNAGLLITGEGSIDLQTMEGKGPYGVASRAKKKNIKVIGLAGSVPTEVNAKLNRFFDFLIPVNQPYEDLHTAMSHTQENLRQTSFRLGKLILEGNLLPKK